MNGRELLQGSFRGLLESVPDAMVIVDLGGKIVLVNAQTEKLFGYRREELLGRRVEMLAPERFREQHAGERAGYSAHPHARPMGTGLELYGRRRDGTEFPVDISLSALETGEGTLVSSAIRDITERERSEEMFRDLLESVPDALVIVDVGGDIVLVNTQTEKLFGYRRAELLGGRVEMLVPEPFRDQHAAQRSGYSADPHTRPMGAGLELYGQRYDGTRFPVEISLSALESENGTLVLSAIRDVTELRRAERDAAHFLAIVESSDDAIIGKDLEWTVTSWNHGAERLFGYTEAEILGVSVSVLVSPAHDDDLLEILRRVRLGERIEEFQTVRVRKDGTHVDVSMTVSPIRSRDGTITGASTIARDVTSHVR